jgi:ABC-type sugar transport system ATPase subunit
VTDAPVLDLKSLSKTYPGVKALQGVSLTVRAGSVHALVGENGAGKSTLIKSLAGVVEPDEMELVFDRQPVEIRNAGDARKLGLAFIHQELNLIDYFNAPENVFLGHGLPRKWGLVDRRALRARAEVIFRNLEVEIDLDEPVRYLTPGSRAMVAIARAFADEATVYFMDEPATALSRDEKEHLFGMVRHLTGQGKSVVYVTHNLDDVLGLSDEVTVFREGRRVMSAATSDVSKTELIAAMTGDGSAGTVERGAERAPAGGSSAPEVLAVDHLTGAGIGPVSLTVDAGEILGIGGLVGSGRSTLLKLLMGALPAGGGTLRLHGKEVSLPRSPAEATRAGIVLIPEERRSEGLALGRSVFENAILSSLRRFSRWGFLTASGARRNVAAAGGEVRLKTTSFNAAVHTLSGGNQQKVLFARAVLARPRILLLDEPTKGVDVGARSEIYGVVRRAAAEGLAVIVVSSDFEEILSLADRLVFLRNGRQIGTVVNSNLDQNQYLTMCYQGVGDE